MKGENIILLKDRVNVHWGGFSQVEATLLLMSEAVKKDFDYAAFISGKDYPIKSNEWLQKKLKAGGEYIQINKMGTDLYAPLSRYKFYYFTDHYNRRDKSSSKTKVYLWLQKTMRKCRISKKIPFQLYTGASWFVLSSKCIKFILHEVATKPGIQHFFKSGFCPDESFFQTIIGNSSYSTKVKECFTYADWTVDPGPAIITEKHIALLTTLENKFFARKFTDNSTEVVDEIDRVLRKQ